MAPRGKLRQDTANKVIQAFAPTRIESVTTSEWTPDSQDRAFRVPVDCTYTINGSGDSGSLLAGSITGIAPDQTYTFSTSMNIEVM
jgi:hypothetical protein